MILEPEIMDDLLTTIEGQKVDVGFSLPDHGVSMSILGRVVRARAITVKNTLRPVVGIQFTERSPQVRGYLIAFAKMARGGIPPAPPRRPQRENPA